MVTGFWALPAVGRRRPTAEDDSRRKCHVDAERPLDCVRVSLVILSGSLRFGGFRVPTDPLPGGGQDRTRVMVHTAAAVRPALEKAAPEFKHDTGITIELRFGPSEKLLTDLQLTRQGDLFLPADDSYVGPGRELGLVEQDYAWPR